MRHYTGWTVKSSILTRWNCYFFKYPAVKFYLRDNRLKSQVFFL